MGSYDQIILLTRPSFLLIFHSKNSTDSPPPCFVLTPSLRVMVRCLYAFLLDLLSFLSLFFFFSFLFVPLSGFFPTFFVLKKHVEYSAP